MSHEEFTAANRAYFDDLAEKYDVKPWQQKISAQITAEIRAKLDFIGVDWVKSSGGGEGEGENNGHREVKLLDYACGTGMVSKALGPYVTSSLGIDLSPAMVTKYNALSTSSNLSPTTAHALTGDLLSNPPSSSLAPLKDFDIAAVGLGFHHFHSPTLAVARLAECLKPGGVLLIIDFSERWNPDGAVPGQHGHHGHHGHDSQHGHQGHDTQHAQALPGQHTVRTHGFSEADMKSIFEKEGLVDVGYSVMEEPVELKMDEGRPVKAKVFLGRATKV